MSRIFNRTLECGCLISSDGGGGLIPCCYPGYGATKAEIKKCEDAWAKWKVTFDYQEHEKECREQ